MLIDKESYQREAFTEWPMRQVVWWTFCKKGGKEEKGKGKGAKGKGERERRRTGKE